MKHWLVKSRDSNYEVVIGRGAWRAFRGLAGRDRSFVFVLTEPHLWKRWGGRLRAAMGLKSPGVIFVRPGESSKALVTVEQIALQLLRARADRRSLLVAFGGGVVGDLAGFVASTYMRGIDYVQIPTTIVAQVDSAIGGKTGVDVGAAKNLVGTFYPPRAVLADPDVLTSLSPRAFRSGLYEVAKHGMLAGPPLFDRLLAALRGASPARARALAPILAEAAKVKVDIVNRDEREDGLRRVLNLGHTFGHAIEAATGFRRLLHGEAVGWGLLGAIRLSQRLRLLRDTEADRMAGLVRSVGPLPSIRGLRAPTVMALAMQDKKSVAGHIHWIVPVAIGKVRVIANVPLKLAVEALKDVQRAEWDA